MPPTLNQIIERLNTRLNHKFRVIYKNGDEIYLRGYELKQALLTGQIKLKELKDIQDETYRENFAKRIKPMPPLTKKDLLKRIGVKIIYPQTGKSYYESIDQDTDSELTFLKVLAGLVVLVIILKSIARR